MSLRMPLKTFIFLFPLHQQNPHMPALESVPGNTTHPMQAAPWAQSLAPPTTSAPRQGTLPAAAPDGAHSYPRRTESEQGLGGK